MTSQTRWPEHWENDATDGSVPWITNDYGWVPLRFEEMSYYLKFTYFRFNIPLNAIIDGVTFRYWGRSIHDPPTYYFGVYDPGDYTRLVVNGHPSGGGRGHDNMFHEEWEFRNCGSNEDTWDLVLTPVIVNSNLFGVAVCFVGYPYPRDKTARGEISCEKINMYPELTVYYHVPPPPPKAPLKWTPHAAI